MRRRREDARVHGDLVERAEDRRLHRKANVVARGRAGPVRDLKAGGQELGRGVARFCLQPRGREHWVGGPKAIEDERAGGSEAADLLRREWGRLSRLAGLGPLPVAPLHRRLGLRSSPRATHAHACTNTRAVRLTRCHVKLWC